jgi:predicted ATPase
MPSNFVVITGGPGSGKTSLIAHLGSLGYATIPEAAIQVINELNRERGVSGQVAWRQQHPAEFTQLVARRQAALDAACPVAGGSLVFCDRGRPDLKAYAELDGVELDSEMRSFIESQRYHKVFVLDTLTDFPLRPATGRTSGRERSVQIGKLLLKAYRSYGYAPVRVPEMSIEDRAHFVLSELGDGDQKHDP